MTLEQSLLPGIHGATICTHTGLYFNFLSPKPEQICIKDIAWGLAHTCRFGGHVSQFYSVAQHSIHCAQIAGQDAAREALMHDAAEAYVGDLVRPLKNLVPQFRQIEDRVEKAIAAKYGLHFGIHKRVVKLADLTMLATEQRDLTAAQGHGWSGLEDVVPLPMVIQPLAPDEAYAAFLGAWRMLGGDIND